MIACTIAGSDSGGGAGIQADLKTFQEFKVFGTSAITALTAQLQAIFADFNVKAIKTGMLFDATIIRAVVNELKQIHIPLVFDPVMIAKGGQSLLVQEAVQALKTELLPLATVCTPNIPEAEVLTGIKIENEEDIERAAQIILSTGVRCVVMKGGHLDSSFATDSIYQAGAAPFFVQTKRLETRHTHGTGCTFSAAITAQLAKGEALETAIIEAKRFVDAAIKHPLHIGQGYGPTNHFAYHQIEGKQQVHVF